MRITQIKTDILVRVVKALVEQGQTSASEFGTKCQYRGRNGNKCAVGHLMTDAMYDKGFEGDTASTLCEENEGLLEKMLGVQNLTDSEFEDLKSFLDDVQYAHDKIPVLERHAEKFHEMLKQHVEEIIEYEKLEVTWETLVSNKTA